MKAPAVRLALATAMAVVTVTVTAATGCSLSGTDAADPGDDAVATVEAFFEARADGDCERLTELVSEDSWSRGGRLDRDGFLVACALAVDAYAPALDRAAVVEADGNSALVSVTVAIADPDELEEREERAEAQASPVHEDGEIVVDTAVASPTTTARALASVIREGGSWKVVTDDELLRIGRSPHQVLRSYLSARAEARCDDVADLVTEAAWADVRAEGRDDFVQRCEDTAGNDSTLAELTAPPRFEVVEDGGQLVGLGEAPGIASRLDEHRTQTIRLVADGLGWKLDREPEQVGWRDLAAIFHASSADGFEPGGTLTTILPHLPSGGGPFDEIEGPDAAERRDEAGFRLGVVGRFERDSEEATALLYSFADGDGARSYADRLTRLFERSTIHSQVEVRGRYLIAVQMQGERQALASEDPVAIASDLAVSLVDHL